VNTDKYITGSCTISNGVVCKNEQMVFENPGANLPDFLLSVYQGFKFSYPKFYKMDNLSKLGWLNAEVLLNDTFVKGKYKPEETGLILANTNSSLDNDLKYYNTISDIPSPSVFVYTLPNIVIGEICIRNNFKGEHAFFIQDKFDAEFIYSQVNYLLERDILQACICGWVDVLGEDYKAALFLIEKNNAGAHVAFSPDNMNRIFNTIN
jgi:ribosomal protein L30E